MSIPVSLLRILAVILLAAGVARAATLVLDDPIVGYANQFDMLRVSACLGLWPVTTKDPRRATPEAPMATYRVDSPAMESCFPGSTVVLAWLGIQAADLFKAEKIDLRWIGGIKLVMLSLLATLLHVALRRFPPAALGHAIVFLLVISDPFNMLFANTFYGEFDALMGAYAAIIAAAAIMLEGRVRWLSGALWLIGLALLGGSRLQHLALPLVMAVVLSVSLRRFSLAFWLPTVIVCAAVILFQWNLQSTRGADAANRVNTIFHTVLPAHDNAAALAERLGLPPRCLELIDTSWFLTRNRNHLQECPEAFTLSRFRLLSVLVTEPSAGASLVFRALHQSGAFRLPYVGEVAGAEMAKVGGFRGLGISELVAKMPFQLFAVMYLVPIWVGLWAAAWLVYRGTSAKAGDRAAGLALTLLAAIIAEVQVTALLGDGFSEYGRHVHLANNAVIASWILIAMLVTQGIFKRNEHNMPNRAAWSAPLVAGVVLISFFVPWMAPKQALGQGLLLQPANEQIHGDTVELSGWAVDPNEVSSVEVRFADGRSKRLAYVEALEVQPYFPVGPTPVRFSGAIAVEDIAEDGMFRILVTSQNGQKSTIDRRFMRLIPSTAPPTDAED